MSVLTVISPAAPAATEAPSPGLWQLGIENQELTSRVARLAEQLDSDDEATRSQAISELEAALLQEEGHRQALDSKADSYCWVIEHLRGQAAYRQQQAKRLVELARGEESRADALEESLVLVLTKLQPAATRFSFPNHELTSRKSQAVEIDDEEALPSEWMTVKTFSQPDKAAIKDALKAGHPIPGAQLISRRSWRIR
ncbi:MAG: siphovirus Gp157 family protein [Synechococcaceae cyanobacterium ELA263]